MDRRNMKFFPLILERVELSTSKQHFFSVLKQYTVMDFDLFRTQELDAHGRKAYEAEIYDYDFRMREIPTTGYKISPFIKTTIYGRLSKNEKGIKLKYIITFNVFTSIIFIALLIGSIYLIYYNIFISIHFEIKYWLISIIPYPLLMSIFNRLANEDKQYIERIIKDVKKTAEFNK